MRLCIYEKNAIHSRLIFFKGLFGVNLVGVVVGVDFGLGGNGDLILWLIMGASAKLVSKQKSILVIPHGIYF